MLATDLRVDVAVGFAYPHKLERIALARYVMANRRAGRFRENEKRSSRDAVRVAMASIASGVNVVADTNPPDPMARRVVVFDADPSDLRYLTPLPDVLVEPEILHWTNSIPPPAELVRVNRTELMAPLGGARDGTLDVLVKGAARPLEGVTVQLFLRGAGTLTRKLVVVTGTDGVAHFSFPSFWKASVLIVIPAGNFWSMIARGPASPVTVDCPLIDSAGPTGWWHDIHGIADLEIERGQGISVGIIDTGVGPHPALEHVVRVGAFINGAALPADNTADVDAHGSHVCGIIGARPTQEGQYVGIAPGAKLYCARVFPDAASGANQGDIANAIDALSKGNSVDLINMSLGSEAASQIELDAIRDALERGTLCICAAGNDGGSVNYPAAFAECVAVSALGRLGWGPPGSLTAARVPENPVLFGNENLYFANFSCFGTQIATAAPGVGIVSTVPSRFGSEAPYAAMDGTSMASPAACGTLAAMLASTPAYVSLPRDESRAQMAVTILRAKCRDIGLQQEYVGRGVLHTD